MARTRMILALALPCAVLGACSPAPPEHPDALSAQLHTADGRPAATATFDFADGYTTVTVESEATGVLAPGLHHQHIHAVGRCDPHSAPPGGGEPGAFLSAGPHFHGPGDTGLPAGDLPALQVRGDGAARLVTTTDALTRDQLVSGDGTAVIVHGVAGGDDAEARVACGVIGAD